MLPLVMIRVGPGHQPQVTATDIQPSMGMAETEARQPPDAAPTGLHETKVSSDGQPVPHVPPRRWRIRSLINVGLFSMMFALVWFGGCNSPWLSNMLRDDLTDVRPDDRTRAEAIESVVERIIKVESNGDPNAKNKRSSATGLGQFLDETWLDLIRTHRPDLAKGRSADETLELRRDPKVARELTVRFTEQNAGMLRKRGLPVTPGTLYLAHFAGGAGAVALLSALEDADAASVMANADATGRTKREKIIKANPFLERFTVADLKSWAHRKMRAPL